MISGGFLMMFSINFTKKTPFLTKSVYKILWRNLLTSGDINDTILRINNSRKIRRKGYV